MLSVEMKNAFWSKRFLFTVLFGLFALSYSAFDSLKGYIFIDANAGDITVEEIAQLRDVAFNRYKVWVYSTDYYIFISPLLATLAYSTSYRLDIQTGFIKFILMRVKKNNYMWTKVLVCMMTGAFSVGLPLLLFYGAISLLLKGDISKPFQIYPFGPLSEIYHTKPDIYIMFVISMHFIFGAIYSVFGLAVSAIIQNRLIAMITPLIFLLVGTVIFVTVELSRLALSVANGFYQMDGIRFTDIILHDIVTLLISVMVFVFVSRKGLSAL